MSREYIGNKEKNSTFFSLSLRMLSKEIPVIVDTSSSLKKRYATTKRYFPRETRLDQDILLFFLISIFSCGTDLPLEQLRTHRNKKTILNGGLLPSLCLIFYAAFKTGKNGRRSCQKSA